MAPDCLVEMAGISRSECNPQLSVRPRSSVPAGLTTKIQRQNGRNYCLDQLELNRIAGVGGVDGLSERQLARWCHLSVGQGVNHERLRLERTDVHAAAGQARQAALVRGQRDAFAVIVCGGSGAVDPARHREGVAVDRFHQQLLVVDEEGGEIGYRPQEGGVVHDDAGGCGVDQAANAAKPPFAKPSLLRMGRLATRRATVCVGPPL